MDSLLVQQTSALLDKENPVGSLSNLCSFLQYEMEHLNWVGFYFWKNNRLELAMFSGKPACAYLPLDKGVCAKAFRENETIVVDDVLSFPTHIACDSASRSEIVIPLRLDNRPIGVLDIDSDIASRFGKEEKTLFEEIAKIIEKSIDLQGFDGFLFSF